MASIKGDTRVLRVLQMGGKYGTIDIVRMANVADPHKKYRKAEKVRPQHCKRMAKGKRNAVQSVASRGSLNNSNRR